ncbi:unnamed protein product [Tilletia laevis]|uniref:DM34 domain-containing protein n=2 Tax=Tilletia TaxID=13289 RepID=A0A9N8LMA0_9BASI|nr:hypothetical protein CF335_g7852 [Tilletia laevis]CAD6887831.1 unnamed protein product [Tilletia caries]CAD6907308.1 unnamed protein product [Tilletia laevis]CAD6924567.1 unnamed protein product [Tilletia caries]CAD6962817.1 unnamed protein product [Tilletia laevis]
MTSASCKSLEVRSRNYLHRCSIADDINVQQPSIVLEIGDLTIDDFEGIFRLNYMSDAQLALSIKVQGNPLSRPSARTEPSLFLSDATSSAASASRIIIFAASTLFVSMHLRFSHIRLRAIIVLVVSRSRGVTSDIRERPLGEPRYPQQGIQ